MSKLRCNCGHVIVDQTDDLPYKAEIVPDQNYGAIFDAVTDSVCKEDTSSGQADAFTGVWIANTKRMYQCEVCGRILIQTGSGDRYMSFLPEDQEGRNIIGGITASDGKN
ncbi:MAG: hypothetical protein IPI81_04365 [Flavobacteriales bacterium]|nr:hypothetical protein [Flavobacteriales bacterium]MCC6937429.1 hypothetical protein [Flavobacteriales bacterium]